MLPILQIDQNLTFSFKWGFFFVFTKFDIAANRLIKFHEHQLASAHVIGCTAIEIPCIVFTCFFIFARLKQRWLTSFFIFLSIICIFFHSSFALLGIMTKFMTIIILNFSFVIPLFIIWFVSIWSRIILSSTIDLLMNLSLNLLSSNFLWLYFPRPQPLKLSRLRLPPRPRPRFAFF